MTAIGLRAPSRLVGFIVAALTALQIMWSALANANPDEWKREGWNKTDFTKLRVNAEEIISGGPPRDGIPPIDDPAFETITARHDLSANEPVIGLEIGGDARAYPLRILMWHEIVNDQVGVVTVTYCPLCNAAIVFDRQLNGAVLDFGTTGKLRHSDLIMYYRQTESWWQQFTGEAIVGAYAGQELKIIPSRLESFADFTSRNPNGKVLVPNNPTSHDYGRNPYEGYDTSAAPFLFRGELPKGIDPMARVVVVRSVGAVPSIVSLQALRERGSMVAGDLTLRWKPGQASALDTDRISEGRDVGTVEAYRLVAGARQPVAYDVTFAFVVNAFHPGVEIKGR
ncbi:MAG: DUF3179 domain-containing protein [Aestuariivirga sp.]